MVLLKAFGSDGFKIFTNYVSRKGQEMVSEKRLRQRSILYA